MQPDVSAEESESASEAVADVVLDAGDYVAADPSEEAAAEAALAEAAEKTEPVAARSVSRRQAKLDTVLAGAVDAARRAILDVAPQEQLGEYVGCSAEGERLVLHRFQADVPGYAGWHWFATLARVPRGKDSTVCEVGLLPSEGSLIAPEWVPWAERVRPEDIAAVEAAAEEVPEAKATDGQASGAEAEPEEAPDTEPEREVEAEREEAQSPGS